LKGQFGVGGWVLVLEMHWLVMVKNLGRSREVRFLRNFFITPFFDGIVSQKIDSTLMSIFWTQ